MQRALARFVIGASTGAIFVASFLIARPAEANGRFPEAQVIETVPNDPNTVFLRTTFGILVSRDTGKTWRWICERALGYDGQWDPPIAVTRDGRLWVGLEDGLASTRDGCELDVAKELDGHSIKDLTTDARGETLWAITAKPGMKSYVWRRSPGKRFERLADLDETNLMTIEVASSPSNPSGPARVYLSGQPYTTIRGQIYRSDDGGATFKTELGSPIRIDDAGVHSAANLVADGPMFIGAIDPRDPNHLLIRHLHARGSDLLITRDGGKTFKNTLSITSAMYGFAKSDDGKIWVGSGLPEHGIYRSTSFGDRFETISNNGVLCLHASGANLFVCQNALTAGAPAIGVSTDEGKTITSLARFQDVQGPVTCTVPDARASLCESSWPETRALFFPDAGSTATSPQSSARRPKRKRDGGAATSDDPSPSKTRSGCGCEIVGARPTAPRGPTDLLCIISGLAPLMVRVRRRLMHGSSLTQRR